MDIKIQRIYRTVIVFVFCFFSVPFFGHAQTSDEHIRSFDISAQINTDATVDVVEKIQYDFAQNEKHGIFRDIPIKYKTTLGNQTVKLSNIHVIDEKGIAYTFTTQKIGNNLDIKIGDADTLISGIHTYIISYKADREIGYFKTYDELYWNITGNDWEVPIDSASAVILLSQSVAEKDIQSSCYYGVFGSTTQCPVVTIKDSSGVRGINVAMNSLQTHEGLTAALGFPKGIVHEPTTIENLGNVLKDNWILVLPIIVFIVMFRTWWKKGKDPKGRGTIVPEYDAPDGLTPLEISTLLHQNMRQQDIPSQIIYLATKGFLKITRVEEKKFMFTTSDYILDKIKKITDAQNGIDKVLMRALYSDDTGDANVNALKLSSLKNYFYTQIPHIRNATMIEVINKGYYPADPQKITLKYIGYASLFILPIIILSGTGLFGMLGIASIVACALIVGFFGIFMPKVTELGAVTRERIEGLKMYIGVAEKDRINFHNAPEKNPELFEKLLPYAMVFGLEKEWAKEFEGILVNPPNWYNDPTGHAFNAVVFTNNLSSFSSVASSTLSSAPGGSSGSGGGGFSGGGGGGGGGGSW